MEALAWCDAPLASGRRAAALCQAFSVPIVGISVRFRQLPWRRNNSLRRKVAVQISKNADAHIVAKRRFFMRQNEQMKGKALY